MSKEILNPTELVKVLKEGRRSYDSAVSRNSGIQTARERLRNLLWNYLDDIFSAVEHTADLEEQATMLQAALDDADKELVALRKAAAGKSAKKTAAKTEAEE